MSGECSSSLNSLPPDGIPDDDFAIGTSFASSGDFFDEETHMEGEGKDDFMMDNIYWGFLSGENTEVSLQVQNLFEHFVYASELKGLSA
jgi:hypothetical protein